MINLISPIRANYSGYVSRLPGAEFLLGEDVKSALIGVSLSGSVLEFTQADGFGSSNTVNITLPTSGGSGATPLNNVEQWALIGNSAVIPPNKLEIPFTQALLDKLDSIEAYATSITKLSDIGNISPDPASNGQSLVWDSALSVWKPGTVTGSGVSSLNSITDVNAPSPTDGQLLGWSATDSEWTPRGLSLNDLINVNASSPSDTQVLRWNGTSSMWEPATLSLAGGGLTAISTTAPLGGDGTVASPLALSSAGITKALLAENSVGEDQLESDAVTADKIGNSAVTTDSIESGAVTTDKIANDAVNSTQIADNAVTEDKIANDAVTEDKIADASVSEDKIKDNSVTEDKLGNASVTEDKIADNAVTQDKASENLKNRVRSVTELPDDVSEDDVVYLNADYNKNAMVLTQGAINIGSITYAGYMNAVLYTALGGLGQGTLGKIIPRDPHLFGLYFNTASNGALVVAVDPSIDGHVTQVSYGSHILKPSGAGEEIQTSSGYNRAFFQAADYTDITSFRDAFGLTDSHRVEIRITKTDGEELVIGRAGILLKGFYKGDSDGNWSYLGQIAPSENIVRRANREPGSQDIETLDFWFNTDENRASYKPTNTYIEIPRFHGDIHNYAFVTPSQFGQRTYTGYVSYYLGSPNIGNVSSGVLRNTRGKPEDYRGDSDLSNILYMLLARLKGCSFANHYSTHTKYLFYKSSSLSGTATLKADTRCGYTTTTGTGAQSNRKRITDIIIWTDTKIEYFHYVELENKYKDLTATASFLTDEDRGTAEKESDGVLRKSEIEDIFDEAGSLIGDHTLSLDKFIEGRGQGLNVAGAISARRLPVGDVDQEHGSSLFRKDVFLTDNLLFSYGGRKNLNENPDNKMYLTNMVTRDKTNLVSSATDAIGHFLMKLNYQRSSNRYKYVMYGLGFNLPETSYATAIDKIYIHKIDTMGSGHVEIPISLTGLPARVFANVLKITESVSGNTVRITLLVHGGYSYWHSIRNEVSVISISFNASTDTAVASFETLDPIAKVSPYLANSVCMPLGVDSVDVNKHLGLVFGGEYQKRVDNPTQKSLRKRVRIGGATNQHGLLKDSSVGEIFDDSDNKLVRMYYDETVNLIKVSIKTSEAKAGGVLQLSSGYEIPLGTIHGTENILGAQYNNYEISDNDYFEDYVGDEIYVDVLFGDDTYLYGEDTTLSHINPEVGFNKTSHVFGIKKTSSTITQTIKASNVASNGAFRALASVTVSGSFSTPEGTFNVPSGNDVGFLRQFNGDIKVPFVLVWSNSSTWLKLFAHFPSGATIPTSIIVDINGVQKTFQNSSSSQNATINGEQSNFSGYVISAYSPSTYTGGFTLSLLGVGYIFNTKNYDLSIDRYSSVGVDYNHRQGSSWCLLPNNQAFISGGRILLDHTKSEINYLNPDSLYTESYLIKAFKDLSRVVLERQPRLNEPIANHSLVFNNNLLYRMGGLGFYGIVKSVNSYQYLADADQQELNASFTENVGFNVESIDFSESLALVAKSFMSQGSLYTARPNGLNKDANIYKPITQDDYNNLPNKEDVLYVINEEG